MLASASLEFEHVSHDYTLGTRVLQDVSFSVKGGQTVALVRSDPSCPNSFDNET